MGDGVETAACSGFDDGTPVVLAAGWLPLSSNCRGLSGRSHSHKMDSIVQAETNTLTNEWIFNRFV